MHRFYLIQFVSIQNLISALHSTLSVSPAPLLKGNNLITRAGEWFPGVTYTVFKTVFLFSISHYTDSFTDIWNLDLLNFWNGVPLTKLRLFTFYYIKFSFLYYGKLKKNVQYSFICRILLAPFLFSFSVYMYIFILPHFIGV